MECNIFLGTGRTGRVFNLFRLFHLREYAGKARIAGIVVIDLNGFWTLLKTACDVILTSW